MVTRKTFLTSVENTKCCSRYIAQYVNVMLEVKIILPPKRKFFLSTFACLLMRESLGCR